MNRELNPHQIDYILYHLSFFCDLDTVREYFVFSGPEIKITPSYKIYFLLSQQSLNLDNIAYYQEIPVLFPDSTGNKPYSITDDNLIFHHDLLKSAFYLLSGYQETLTDETDWMGRYPFKNSIQYKLGIVEKPVVNYYFQWIVNGLKNFCNLHNIPFGEKRVFGNGVFLLSHDVDRVYKYDYFETAHKILELAGLKKSQFSINKLLHLIPKYLYNFLFLPRSKDPYWNFKKQREMECSLNMISTWFFLEKQDGHQNSRYRFNELSIRKLIKFLADEGCEIGLHGTVHSASDVSTLKKSLKFLQANCPTPVEGIRQHKLIFSHPKTFQVQQKGGFVYDHTLTYAEHEGFRNSYCFPFRPYNFSTDKMMDIIAIPLVAMDGTLFYYRGLNYQQITAQVEKITGEVKKFGGVFSLLWHNSHFDEDEFPGIYPYYFELLKQISSQTLVSKTCKEVVSIFKKV